MSRILDTRKKRAELWDRTKAFLEERRGEDSPYPEDIDVGDVHEHGGNHAETDHVRQAVELEAELRSAAETSCYLPVHTVEKHGHEDKPCSGHEPPVEQKKEGHHAAQQVAAGHHIRDDLPEREASPLSTIFHRPSLQGRFCLRKPCSPQQF